jgi:hypothetical protein
MSVGEWLLANTYGMKKKVHENEECAVVDVAQTRAEFENAAEALLKFHVVYLGNQQREGSHISIETEDWVGKVRERTNVQGIRSATNLARQYAALAQQQYQQPTRTLLHDRLLHGDKVPGRLIIKKNSNMGVRTLDGLLSRSDTTSSHDLFVVVEPLSGDSMAPLPSSPSDVHEVKYVSVNWSEVMSIEYFTDTARAIFPNIILPPEQCSELRCIVQREFDQQIVDIRLLRTLNNTTYHLMLHRGWRGVLKEYPPGADDLITRDHYFSNLLAQEGLAPRARKSGLRLFSQFIGTTSLSEITGDEKTLAKYYDDAIKILIALDRLSRRNGLGDKEVLALDSTYYGRKCGEEYDPRNSSYRTIIPAGFFPVHIRVGEHAQVIDLEDVMHGPVEYALAALLINPYHHLSEEFIRTRIDGYADQVPVDKKQLYTCFNDHAKLMYERISRIIKVLHNRNEETNITASGINTPFLK